MTDPKLIISFSEGEVEPQGKYGFELDLSGQSGCDVLEQMMFLIRSLESPYQIFSNAEPVTADQLGQSYSRLTVWTNDRTNSDFLLLMSELGVKVHRTL
jgi:DNA polymerase III delta prime subunit